MNENNKRLVKNSAIMYVQLAIHLFVSLLTARLMLQALGASDYGTYNVVGGFVSMMVIVSHPMKSGTMRFFAFDLGKNDHEQLTRDFNTTNIIYWIFALVILLFLETAGLWFLNHKMEFEAGRMDVVNWVYQFSVFAFLLNVVAIPYNSLLLAHENIFISSLFEILQKVFQLVAVLLLWVIPYDNLIAYSAMMFLISASMRIAPQLYCKWKYKETRLTFEFDVRYFKSILAYSGYCSIGVVSCVGMSQGINVLLNMFFGTVVNAAKGICTSVVGIVESMTSNLFTPAWPQLTKYYATDNQEKVWYLVVVMTKGMFFISMIITIPLCLEVDYVLRVWLGDYPPYTALFIQLSLTGNMISVNGMMLSGALQAANKIKHQQLSATVVNLLNLPLSYFALSLGMGPLWPFIIMAVLKLVALRVNVMVVRKDMQKDMTFYYAVVGRLFLAFLMASLLPVILHCMMSDGFLRLVSVTMTSIIMSTLTVYYVCLNVSERSDAVRLVRSTLRFVTK